MNYELLLNNSVELWGKVKTNPTFTHTVIGENFYEFDLEVPRLSDSSDIIPITISEKLFKKDDLKINAIIAINGQFRSYNKLIDGKSKLMLTVFVRELIDVDTNKNPNIIKLKGFLCKEPIFRTTPFKREICDILLAVNRAYNKSDYIPSIAWGRNARFVKDLPVGTKLDIEGRIQSRIYQKKLSDEEIISKTAYEISISKIDIIEKEEPITTVELERMKYTAD